MKRFPFLFLLMLIAAPVLALADANQYNDPAMSFTAPPGFHPVAVPSHDPANFDDPAVMAAFVSDPSKPDFSQIVLRMQSFSANAEGFEMTVENDLRNESSDVFIKKSATTLSNGMPAYWEEITMGSGFEQQKIFQYVWSDGVRGVTLAITSRNGSLDEPKAKRLLSNVSAVAYPKYRY
ncbi:MAG TPA: hypothetical protein VFE17_08080 [Candidatus Baltobacteraceae bacterium]|jgi:hypothetical protein|nr:hypothetical protein [Candidatus Baltobacteraceae bacterium]